MARLIIMSKESFLRAVRRSARPETHVVLTDRATFVEVVPVVSSRHRHYLRYSTSDDQELHAILLELEKLGFEILEGFVQVQVQG